MMTFWTLWRLHTNMLSMSSNSFPTLSLPCLAVRYRRSCCTVHLRTFGGAERRMEFEHVSDTTTQKRFYDPTHRFGIVIWSRFLNSNVGEVHVWEEALSRNLDKVGIFATGWCPFMQEDTFVIDGAEGVACVWEAGKALSVQPGLQRDKLKDKMQWTDIRKCQNILFMGNRGLQVFSTYGCDQHINPQVKLSACEGEKQAWKRSLVLFWNLYKSCISVPSITIDQIGVLYVPLSHEVFHLSCILLLIWTGDVLFNEWTKCRCLEAT